MEMLTPSQQISSLFFLGGPEILVASPAVDMEHDLKGMVLRSNNIHFSRATAFHEMFPGHRVQLYMADRYNSQRKAIFDIPFFEGWALYWEFLLYSRDDF
jgi:hypothetical protein